MVLFWTTVRAAVFPMIGNSSEPKQIDFFRTLLHVFWINYLISVIL